MDVVFLGSGAFGVPTLRALAATHNIVGVVTQPDRPAGRGKKPTPTPIAAEAETLFPGVPVVKPENINEPSVRDHVRSWPATAWVVIAFGQKLGRELLADRFAINLHASRLPRWRGAAPIHHAIMAGDATTGNSVIALAERMDAGVVYGMSERAIERTVTTAELHDLLAADGPELVLSVLRDYAAERVGVGIGGEVQDEAAVTLAGKLSRADALIDVRGSAAVARCRINGLSPWPGVTVRIGGESVKLLRADHQDDAVPREPGFIDDAEAGLVACGEGGLRLLEVQPVGKRRMSWADFARARPWLEGLPLETLE